MRTTWLALCVIVPGALLAQRRDTVSDQDALPRDVRREVVDRWNASAALRSSGRLELDEGREVKGDVAVQNGPLVIAGHVTGSIVAINADVLLKPTARIDGDVLVVGGQVVGRNSAVVGGEIRIYRATLAYHLEGERMVADRGDTPGAPDGWWRRIEGNRGSSWSEPIRLAQAGPYNRVEGLPIEIGPSIYEKRAWGSFRLDASGIVRTGTSLESKGSQGDIGHDVHAEFRSIDADHWQGLAIGARLYNAVQGVETWQLSDLEVALASFLSHRDYRDYYQHHGASAYLTVFARPGASLTTSFSEERWSSRNLIDPFTLFYGGATWRANPLLDEGLFHIANATAHIDTRTDPDDPWSGWYGLADVEGGRGYLTSIGATTDNRSVASSGLVTYSRGFLDLRRYNRLSRQSQLNMRVVLGGSLNGDPLPLERRLSVDGPGALPGFRFRDGPGGDDVATCSVGPAPLGQPAQCDRIALAQIEYRGDFRLAFDGTGNDQPMHFGPSHGDAAWVFFADAGRGWLVGDTAAALTYRATEFPSLSTFRSDVGLGIEVGSVGVYAAKSVSTPAEGVNFFMRLRHRF